MHKNAQNLLQYSLISRLHFIIQTTKSERKINLNLWQPYHYCILTLYENILQENYILVQYAFLDSGDNISGIFFFCTQTRYMSQLIHVYDCLYYCLHSEFYGGNDFVALSPLVDFSRIHFILCLKQIGFMCEIDFMLANMCLSRSIKVCT